MAQTVICERCGDENPADARFCIDCGAALLSAATGPTTRLGGLACPSCATVNPDHARFCVVCGRDLAGKATARPAAPKRSPQPSMPPARPAAPRPPQQSYPRTATPPTLAPYHPAPPYVRPARPRGGNPAPVIFLIGMAVLMINNALWPGVLVLLGVCMLIGQVSTGRPARSLGALFWIGGLMLLLSTGMFWPGFFVLFLVYAIFNGLFGGHRHPW